MSYEFKAEDARAVGEHMAAMERLLGVIAAALWCIAAGVGLLGFYTVLS